MRGKAKIVLAVTAVLLLAIVTSVGAQEGGLSSTRPEATAADKSAADTEVDEAVAEAAEATEEAATLMATITYFDGGKGEKGAKKTMDVPYLPEGRKLAILETSKGVVKIELWEEFAPNTVVNFVHLANSGRYDGVQFHRVMEGFMAQTGDVEHKSGTGGPGYTIPAEFNADLHHTEGVVSMARASDPDSAGSQFFIMLASATHLDGSYAAFGEVVEGMEIIHEIKKGTGNNGAVDDPDTIVTVRVETVLVEAVPEE